MELVKSNITLCDCEKMLNATCLGVENLDSFTVGTTQYKMQFTAIRCMTGEYLYNLYKIK